jgi:hypothetical protein
MQKAHLLDSSRGRALEFHSQSLRKNSATVENSSENQMDLNLGSYGGSSLHDGDITVVIAVAIVLMMEMAIDEVIDMVAVRHRRMPATWTMNMVSRMPTARMPAGA